MLTKVLSINWPGKGTLGCTEGNSLFLSLFIVVAVTIVVAFFFVYLFLSVPF